MKPILLKLSGLQSYREAQEVDFERLCEAGVFGIFGPTGSGKSSILDAVTLALYGKVERAAGGTQGIMNQAEKTLAVAFTFDLAGGGERKRYRVERQFKRGGDVSVSNTLSRFVEVTDGGDVVVADKLADVTRCVEERIGLNMQDFTRAVVLPQGKFAEFLSLTGKDRRSMLQRLFRLERFGDGLALKLSQRLKTAEAALQEAAAEQLGLGDASAAAAEATEARYREAAAAAAEARAALAEAERLHAERAQVRERLLALREKEALHAQLLADAPRVAALERELQRLAAAERLLPALAAAGAAEAALAAAASRRETAVRAHAARQEAAAAATAAWTAAAAEAAAGEPRLALRLDQLAGARRLEGEAAELAAGVAADEARARDAAERRRAYGEQAAKAQEMLGRAAAKQAELRGELKAAELTAADRERRARLTKRLQQHGQLAAQAEASRAELEAAAGRLAQASAAREAARAEHRSAREALAAHAAELLPAGGVLAHAAGKLREAASAIPQWAERAREAQREQARLELAARLAADLRDGEACPVCGSREHRALHRAPLEAEDRGDALLRGWEELNARCQRLQLELSPLQTRAEAAAERLLETLEAGRVEDAHARAAISGAEPERGIAYGSGRAAGQDADGTAASGAAERLRREAAAAAEAAVAVQAESLAAFAPAGPEPAPAEALDRCARALDAVRELTAGAGQRLAAGEKAAAAARARCVETERRLEQSAAACATQEALADRARAHHAQCRQALERELEEWTAQLGPELRPDTAETALLALDGREAAADELRGRLDRSVTYIEETTRTKEESERLSNEAELEAARLEASLHERREQLDEKRQRLSAVTEGQPAAELIREAERELAGLRTRTAERSRRHEDAQRELQQAAEQRTGAAEAERAAEERRREAGAEWTAALERSPFESADEVNALRPMLDRQAAIADLVAKHREEERQLAAQASLLREQLGGRTLTEEEWEASAAELSARRASGELCLQAAAKAERDLESLRSKQERWLALEAKRSAMERLTNRLKSLQTVFRGNAFVEYVAEEQLVQVCRAASERLGFLTKRRYALEVDSGGGFVIRDDAAGGLRRPVSTLSGGETFLASLALALALSGQIQLRGKYPLQFFFLDEGFGTLDPELLDTVITALEKLHHETLAVGVISHVPELRARLPRRLIVTPSEPFGRGSAVELETM